MFIFNVDPGYVESASPRRLAYWHTRAVAFVLKQQAAIAEREAFEKAIGAAVKALPSR